MLDEGKATIDFSNPVRVKNLFFHHASFFKYFPIQFPEVCFVNIGYILLADTPSVLLRGSSLFLIENKMRIESNPISSSVSHGLHKISKKILGDEKELIF